MISLIPSVTETNLQYFFSALAQCSAAFAALVGVFAVFRLQVNAARIAEEYASARWWLREKQPYIDRASSLPSQEVKKVLTEIKEGKKGDSQQATEFLAKITKAESFPKDLVLSASEPLRYWAEAFVYSIALLPFSRQLQGRGAVVLIVTFLSLTATGLWKSRGFVQRCLDFERT